MVHRLENKFIFATMHPMTLADDLIAKGVLKSPHIIQAFRDIHRVDFMPEDERPLAEVDEPFPIGEGQTISQPYTVAFMLELLQPKPGQYILDVGFGSGWQSALLAHIVTNNKQTAGRVFAIERLVNVCAFGKKNIAKYNFITSGVVETYCRDAVGELSDVVRSAGGFDGIIAAASLRAPADEKYIPSAWKKHLKFGGKIVMPIGESLWVFSKRKNGSFEKKEYPGFVFVPLVISKKKNKPTSLYNKLKQTVSKPSFFPSFLVTFILSMVAVLLCLATPPPNSTFPKEVTIPRNFSAREAAELLAQEGIIRSESHILFLLFVRDELRKIQAGTYFFEYPEWVHAVAAEITDPKTRKIVAIRITEGSTLRGIAAQYEERGVFMPTEFFEVTGVPGMDWRTPNTETPDYSDLTKQFPFLVERPPTATLEGFLLPDTYEFFDSVTPGEVVFKMLQNFQSKLTKVSLFEEIKNRGLSLYEVLTLASLLEREAIHYEDKRIIAGIIQNRLKKNMPLQIDASLMYVTGRGSLLLTKDDLESDSPYNTYTHKGLPLGPIANPGIDSIKAVLDPQETSYFYYLSDRQYTIHYSMTFEEHKQKKVLYIP